MDTRRLIGAILVAGSLIVAGVYFIRMKKMNRVESTPAAQMMQEKPNEMVLPKEPIAKDSISVNMPSKLSNELIK